MTKITLDCRKAIVLDWNDGQHWSGKQTACVHCGKHSLLLDDTGRPAHKVCTPSRARRADQQTKRNPVQADTMTTTPNRLQTRRIKGWRNLKAQSQWPDHTSGATRSRLVHPAYLMQRQRCGSIENGYPIQICINGWVS
jgi:hypothetical protein